jgi:hypothetical protein
MSLHELQTSFARGLRSSTPGEQASETWLSGIVDAPSGIAPADRFEVYRNNTRQFFLAALKGIYPVLQRRVGAGYFRKLGHEYRRAHPSRHGDLHWVGAEFPAWLARHLAGSQYAWLADLARLEWACEVAQDASDATAVAREALGRFASGTVEATVLRFHPSVQLVRSPYPLWTLWRRNQDDADGAPVDLASGAENCVVACTGDRVAVYRVGDEGFALLERLLAGEELGRALAGAGLEPDALVPVLAWLFEEGLVVDVSPSAPASR